MIEIGAIATQFTRSGQACFSSAFRIGDVSSVRRMQGGHHLAFAGEADFIDSRISLLQHLFIQPNFRRAHQQRTFGGVADDAAISKLGIIVGTPAISSFSTAALITGAPASLIRP